MASTVEYDSAFSRRDFARGVHEAWPSEIRGRREDRVRAAPAVSRANSNKENAHEHTGSAETLRPSPRSGFTAYFALSSATGLSCHRHLRLLRRTLDTSVGVSGPHDFAVRVSTVRQWCGHVHRIPSRVRDDRETPLLSGRDGVGCRGDLRCPRREIFLEAGLDRANQPDRADEIRFLAQSERRRKMLDTLVAGQPDGQINAATGIGNHRTAGQ